ncbi:MAG: carbohydrate-binding family 9-like protein [Deltaproteobacteria bacterium]|nr:carbohydrate-binding family 9-like protein [Deltaproteobacteria bacterium]
MRTTCSTVLVAAATVSVAVAACDGRVTPTRVVDKNGPTDAAPVTALAEARPLDVGYEQGLRLVGVQAPPSVARGGRASFTLYVLVEDDVTTRKPKVGAHLSPLDGEVVTGIGDHALLGSRGIANWRKGDLLIDTFTIVLPTDLAADELALWVGIQENKDQWKPVLAAGTPALRRGRIEVARLKLEGAAVPKAEAQVPRAAGTITVDGKLDEADWARAARLGPFVAWDGMSAITRPTTARMLWSADALYLAFEAVDPDVHTPYKKHDDPIYDSEAVEIFVDADGDGDVYVELQSAPNDVTFDAAFAGGARKNMDAAFEAGHQVKTAVDGTLNDDKDEDRGFVSEWRIPVAALKDVPAGEPKVGASWKVNLFRLERLRAKQRITGSEASAWSTPLAGDFHNLARFGTVTFVE